MARLVGLIGNRADLASRVLASEEEALRVHSKGTALGWGIGFYQGGEVLMRRRPIDEHATVDIAKVAGQETSFTGLEKPLFTLKNPGIISIPLGFLAVLLGSLLGRDKRSEEMWDEVYARQNTGLLVSKPQGH